MLLQFENLWLCWPSSTTHLLWICLCVRFVCMECGSCSLQRISNAFGSTAIMAAFPYPVGKRMKMSLPSRTARATSAYRGFKSEKAVLRLAKAWYNTSSVAIEQAITIIKLIMNRAKSAGSTKTTRQTKQSTR